MKKIIVPLLMSLLLIFTGCTKQGIKNKALVLSAEKFDNEAQLAAKENFADPEQQKVFSEFIKVSSRMDVEKLEMQGDSEATARLVIESFPKNLYADLKNLSDKEWKEKVKAAKETKIYNLKLKKINGIWEIVERKEEANAP